MTQPMDTLAQRIRRARIRAGKSQAEIARAFSIRPPSVNQWETGRTAPSVDRLSKLAELFGVSVDWLTGGNGVSTENAQAHRVVTATPAPIEEVFPGIKNAGFGDRDLPIRGRAEAGSRGALMLTDDPIEWMYRPPELIGVKDAFGMYVMGDSMAGASLKHGTIVHVHPHKPARPGDLVVLVKASNEALIKRLVRRTDQKVVLAQTDPEQEITVAAADVKAIYLVTGATFS